jgi:ABC-type amino acid transport substrate-binding protein
MRAGLCAILLACSAFAAGCGGSATTSAGGTFEPATPGVLTVATAFLDAPGFWQGRPPTEGFEAALAAALAKKLGLERVDLEQVPFADIVAGNLRGADVALSQLTPTDERERVLDFTTPYLNAPPGVLAVRAAEASDISTLQQLRWVVSSASTLTPVVTDRVRPDEAPIVVVDRAEALDVLRQGRAQALMLDLPVALGLAGAEPGRFHVVGQLSGGEGLAVALPHDSPNTEIVDSEIRRLQADGTIDELVSRWLGTNQDDVPLILSEG